MCFLVRKLETSHGKTTPCTNVQQTILPKVRDQCPLKPLTFLKPNPSFGTLFAYGIFFDHARPFENAWASQSALCKKSAQMTHVACQKLFFWCWRLSKSKVLKRHWNAWTWICHILSHCRLRCKPAKCQNFSGTELCSGNVVALLAAPGRLFASSDAKRARLCENVLATLNLTQHFLDHWHWAWLKDSISKILKSSSV